MKKIQKTIEILLQHGANPNVGEVPLPPLILSVFTKNPGIVNSLLNNEAFVNITTVDDDLTALHVLVSLKPPCQEYVDILRALLQYNANPNLRNAENHWAAEKSALLVGQKNDSNHQAKTPLHILALRYDYRLDPNGFLNQMASVLINFGGEANSEYLWHVPLTIAMLRGNLQLMETLLKSGADPNVQLGNGMGVPITVLILKRYEHVLPSEICRDVYEILYENNANPLKQVQKDRAGNAVEFMIKEHEVLKVEFNIFRFTVLQNYRFRSIIMTIMHK